MESTSVTLTVPGNDLMSELVGEQDALLRRVQGAFPGSSIHVRGNAITIDGEHAPTVRLVFDEVVALLQKGLAVDERTLDRAIDMVRADEKPSEVLTTEILRTSRGKPVRARSAGQKRYVEAVAGGIITFAVGPAGTGKSWLAVAMAVRALQAGQVDRIVLTRPLVEAGERVGFLPGDLMAKVDPYLRPLYDALFDMVDAETAERLLDRGQVEVAPLAFMRGRTLNNSFIILDEAQNTTPEQMKMFLTRVGFGSRVVVTGDVSQVDVPGGRSGLGGLEDTLSGIDGLSFVRLGARDVVRHRIVQDIVEAYDREASARKSAAREAVTRESGDHR
ncbi:MAG: PhoH family protein [Actinomycetota bacterium]|nr:PhoH family protein [Actinomycetota bacterium]MED6328102.1 PhoH family protein [Actinomycetota bacterium]MEE2958260.1 PhoH family protein [Actinomycetota bacterium]